MRAGRRLAQATIAEIDCVRKHLSDARRADFDALGDLVVTGPTLTNVNDFRVILIGKARA